MSNTALPIGTSAGMDAMKEAAARTLILALIHRYASVAREHGDRNDTTKLFHPDGTVRFPDGRDMPASRLREVTQGDTPKLLRHHLTTVDVQFVSPDEAHCQSYIIACTDLKMPDHWGRWDDVVRRGGDEKWLFQEKVVVVDGLDPDGWLAGIFGRGAVDT
ncbi:hypothetical protein LTR37_019433 [Vermiconidia calcicola]|uniref:Uncharacterized protein n=1 Tax=Vermiconidia calcicola TaxID=1690605 RepID=A0ACC3MFX5_9PEZI|nr:hypothetical protein LTR37_019433 [Vermiconidia calcicola]